MSLTITKNVPSSVFDWFLNTPPYYVFACRQKQPPDVFY